MLNIKLLTFIFATIALSRADFSVCFDVDTSNLKDLWQKECKDDDPKVCIGGDKIRCPDFTTWSCMYGQCICKDTAKPQWVPGNDGDSDKGVCREFKCDDDKEWRQDGKGFGCTCKKHGFVKTGQNGKCEEHLCPGPMIFEDSIEHRGCRCPEDGTEYHDEKGDPLFGKCAPPRKIFLIFKNKYFSMLTTSSME